MIKCDSRAKARCPFKETCCGDEEGYFLEGSDCDKFNQKVCAPPPTNADHIRAMSDEDLSACLTYSICKYVQCRDSCPVVSWEGPGGEMCKANILHWLQQPAKEEQ